MELQQAQAIAERVRDGLAPHCDRIEIAGSIRRRKPDVGDIEIVCIPRKIRGGLFQDELETSPDFCALVDRWPAVKGKPTGKYTQRILPDGIKLDIFMARPANWGLIFAIRTGSADFSHRRLATRWKQLGYTSVGGMLTRAGKTFAIREERDLFTLLNIPWISPEARNVEVSIER